MEYKNHDHELQKEGAAFYQALSRKCNGVPPASDEAVKVKSVLKQELQDKLTKDRMRIVEGIYGWYYTVAYGRAGENVMLKPEDLA